MVAVPTKRAIQTNIVATNPKVVDNRNSVAKKRRANGISKTELMLTAL